jgi:hypothetical protein
LLGHPLVLLYSQEKPVCFFLLFLYKQDLTTVGASTTVFAKKIISCIKQLHGKHPA